LDAIEYILPGDGFVVADGRGFDCEAVDVDEGEFVGPSIGDEEGVVGVVDAAIGREEGDRAGGEVHDEVGDCGGEKDALGRGLGFTLGGGGARFRGVLLGLLLLLLFSLGRLDGDESMFAALGGGEDIGGRAADEGPAVFAEGADEGGDLGES